METLMQVLPIVLYILGAILLAVLVVLGIYLIGSITRLNRILDNVEGKVNSLNTLFHIIDTASNTLTSFTESVVGTISNFIGHFFSNKKVKNIEEEEENE